MSVSLFLNYGGRVSWYKGDAGHSKIAFDVMLDTGIHTYTINPDRSNPINITETLFVDSKSKGQPAWHSDGERLLLQVLNPGLEIDKYTHPSFGFGNSLYLLDVNSKQTIRLVNTPNNHALLHPHYSDTGTLLIYSYRTPTGLKWPWLNGITPGGENPWVGWSVAINSQHYKPNGPGFYETHQVKDGRVIYSYTDVPGGFVDEVYSLHLFDRRPKQITNTADSWTEHGIYSSNGDFAYMSSFYDSGQSYPGSDPNNLTTELFVNDKRVTFFNDSSPHIVSDFSWNREGTQIIAQVVPKDQQPQLWMVNL